MKQKLITLFALLSVTVMWAQEPFPGLFGTRNLTASKMREEYDYYRQTYPQYVEVRDVSVTFNINYSVDDFREWLYMNPGKSYAHGEPYMEKLQAEFDAAGILMWPDGAANLNLDVLPDILRNMLYDYQHFGIVEEINAPVVMRGGDYLRSQYDLDFDMYLPDITKFKIRPVGDGKMDIRNAKFQRTNCTPWRGWAEDSRGIFGQIVSDITLYGSGIVNPYGMQQLINKKSPLWGKASTNLLAAKPLSLNDTDNSTWTYQTSSFIKMDSVNRDNRGTLLAFNYHENWKGTGDTWQSEDSIMTANIISVNQYLPAGKELNISYLNFGQYNKITQQMIEAINQTYTESGILCIVNPGCISIKRILAWLQGQKVLFAFQDGHPLTSDSDDSTAPFVYISNNPTNGTYITSIPIIEKNVIYFALGKDSITDYNQFKGVKRSPRLGNPYENARWNNTAYITTDEITRLALARADLMSEEELFNAGRVDGGFHITADEVRLYYWNHPTLELNSGQAIMGTIMEHYSLNGITLLDGGLTYNMDLFAETEKSFFDEYMSFGNNGYVEVEIAALPAADIVNGIGEEFYAPSLQSFNVRSSDVFYEPERTAKLNAMQVKNFKGLFRYADDELHAWVVECAILGVDAVVKGTMARYAREQPVINELNTLHYEGNLIAPAADETNWILNQTYYKSALQDKDTCVFTTSSLLHYLTESRKYFFTEDTTIGMNISQLRLHLPVNNAIKITYLNIGMYQHLSPKEFEALNQLYAEGGVLCVYNPDAYSPNRVYGWFQKNKMLYGYYNSKPLSGSNTPGEKFMYFSADPTLGVLQTNCKIIEENVINFALGKHSDLVIYPPAPAVRRENAIHN